MPLSYQPLYLVGVPTHPELFRRSNQEDFSKEYFQRIKTTQTATGRVDSTWNSLELNRQRVTVPDEAISGLYSDADKHHDLFSSNGKKPKHKKRTRPLGLHNDRYKAALDNGPWDVLYQRTQNTRREATRKLIEDELKKRQQESLLGTASLPTLPFERTVLLSEIIKDKKNDAFYARDLLYAPQIVATKPSHHTGVEFRLPSLSNPNVKRGDVYRSKYQMTRKDIREKFDPIRECPPNLPSVSRPYQSPLPFVPEEDLDSESDFDSEDDVVIVCNQSEGGEFNRPSAGRTLEDRSSSTAGQTLESRSSDNPRSILKSPQSPDRNDTSISKESNNKTVTFLDNDYLERVRLYYVNHSNPLSPDPPSKDQGTQSGNSHKSIPIMSVIRLDRKTNDAKTDNSDLSMSKTSLPPWRSLAEIFKSKSGSKRKRKKRKRKKKANGKPSQTESPTTESVSDQSTSPDLSEQIEHDTPLNKSTDEQSDDTWQPNPPQNRGDGIVYKLQANGSLVEYKVPNDEISGHVTDAQLSYHVRDILSRPILARKPSPPPVKPGSRDSANTSRPLKILDTALRRKSLPPTSAPFLPPELHPPKNDPRVSACVNWTTASHNRKTAPKDTAITDDDLEVSPMLLGMRHCRYIRWIKKDEMVLERLHDLEDQLVQKSEEEVFFNRSSDE